MGQTGEFAASSLMGRQAANSLLKKYQARKG